MSVTRVRLWEKAASLFELLCGGASILAAMEPAMPLRSDFLPYILALLGPAEVLPICDWKLVEAGEAILEYGICGLFG